MEIGKLDRRIVIESRSAARGTAGSETYTWAPLVTVWAQVIEGTVNERFEADSRRETRMVVFRVRYRPTITAAMRVLYNSKYYGITGIKEIGRRQYLDLDTEYLQAGQDGL